MVRMGGRMRGKIGSKGRKSYKMKKTKKKSAVEVFVDEANNLSGGIKTLLIIEVVIFLVFVPISLLLVLI